VKYNIIGIRALSTNILTVAIKGEIGDWAAYINTVPGVNHVEEANSVAADGVKLTKAVAEAIFPNLGLCEYRGL